MKKYEKEIREILDKMDSFVPDVPAQEKEREKEPRRKPTNIGVIQPPPPPRPIRAKQSAGTRFRAWLRANNITGSLGYQMLGFVFLIGSLMLLENVRNISIIAQILALIGFALYISPLAIRFFGGNPDRDPSNKTWRGSVIENDSIFTWKKLKSVFTSKPDKPKNDPWNKNNRNNRW